MTHLNLSLCVFLLIFAAHSTCFVLNKFVHENGVKEFTVEKLIKKNNCICTCSCVPKNVPIEPEAPQLPEFAHKRQLWKDFKIVKEIKKNKCSCSCACGTFSPSPTSPQQTQSTENRISTLTPKSTVPANSISTSTLVDELHNTTFAEITPSTSDVTTQHPMKAESPSPVVPTHDFQIEEQIQSTVEWTGNNKSLVSSTNPPNTKTTAPSDAYSTSTSTTNLKEVQSTESSTTPLITITAPSTTTIEMDSSVHPSSTGSTLSNTESTSISSTTIAATTSVSPSTTNTSSDSTSTSVFPILNTTATPITTESSTLNPVFKEKVANLLNRLKEKLQKLREATATTQQVEEAAENDSNAKSEGVEATTMSVPSTASTTPGFNIDSELETTLAVLNTHRSTTLTAAQELANARNMLNGLKRKLEELKFQASIDDSPTNLSKSHSDASLGNIERLLMSAEGRVNSDEKDFNNNEKYYLVNNSTISFMSTSRKAVTTNSLTTKSTSTTGSTRNRVNTELQITSNGEVSTAFPPNSSTKTSGTWASTHLLTSTIIATNKEARTIKSTPMNLHVTEKTTIPSTQSSSKAEVTRTSTAAFSKKFTIKDVTNSPIIISTVASSITTPSDILINKASETTAKKSANTTDISMNTTSTTLKASPPSVAASTTSSSSASTSTSSTVNHASSTVSDSKNITKTESSTNAALKTPLSNTSSTSITKQLNLALTASTIRTHPPTSTKTAPMDETSTVTTLTNAPLLSSSKTAATVTASPQSTFSHTTTSTSFVPDTSASSTTERQSITTTTATTTTTTTATLTSTAIAQPSLKMTANKMLEEFQAQRERTTNTQSVNSSSTTNPKVISTQKLSDIDQKDAEHAFVIDTEDENIEKGDETKTLEESDKPDKFRTTSKTALSVGSTSLVVDKSIVTSMESASPSPTTTTTKSTNYDLSGSEMPFAFVTEAVETEATDYDGTTAVNTEMPSPSSELFEASTASSTVKPSTRPLARQPNEKWANEMTNGDFTAEVVAIPNPLPPAMIITTTQKTALFGSIRNSEFEAQRKTKILLPPPPPLQVTTPWSSDIQQNVNEHRLQSSTDMLFETKQMHAPTDQTRGETFHQQQVGFSSTISLAKTIFTTTLPTLTQTTKKSDHLQLTENLRVAKQNLEERLKQARQLREELRQLEMLSAIRLESSANDAESMLELQQRRRHIEERLAQLAQKERWHRELIQRYQLRQRALEAATNGVNDEKADSEGSIGGDRSASNNNTPDVVQFVATTNEDLPTTTDSPPPILRPISTPSDDNDENEDPSARVCQQVRRFVTTFRVRDPVQWVRNNCVFVKQYYPSASCTQIQQLFAECF